MAKGRRDRPRVILPEQDLAADRQPQTEWPENNFILIATMLAGAIVVIGLGFAFDVIR